MVSQRKTWLQRTPFEGRFALALLAIFVGSVSLAGGSARADALPLLGLFPVVVICAAGFLFLARPVGLRSVRAPLLLLGGLATVIGIQLVPLPPSLAASIPSDAIEGLVNGGASWRPLSLAPDRTWGSLFSLLPPACALFAVAFFRESRSLMLSVAIAVALLSAVLGVLQIAAGASSPFYFYEFTNRGMPTGLLANRNHQAVLLVATLPLLRAWGAESARDSRLRVSKSAVALVLITFFALLVLVTGSRSGAILLCIALPASLAMGPRVFPRDLRPIWKFAASLGGVVLLVGIGATAIYADRALSVDRLAGTETLESELRLANMPPMLSLLNENLPFGTGFGAFDPAFRGVEPDSLLRTSYFNNAHNDLLELAITGGIPALLVLCMFLIWWFTRSTQAFSARSADDKINASRAASIAILILLLASLTDYPLRTPLLGAFFAFLCGILALACDDARGRGNRRLQVS